MQAIIARSTRRRTRFMSTNVCVVGRRLGLVLAGLACLFLSVLGQAWSGESDKRDDVSQVVSEASDLIEHGRVQEAVEKLKAIGPDSLAALVKRTYDKFERARVAMCQYYLGDSAGCLDNAGEALFGITHAPFDIYYYGALASSRERLWPLVLMFTAGDAKVLAQQHALVFGTPIDQGKVRALEEHQGVALMYMDRFAEAERIFQALFATSKDDKERSAYEERLREVAKRQKAVASGEEKPFSEQAFWIEALSSPSSWVRARAMKKVATIQDETVQKSLMAGLKDPAADVRSAAAIALGNRGDPQAAQALQGLLRDPSPEVRDSARLALQELGKEVPPE